MHAITESENRVLRGARAILGFLLLFVTTVPFARAQDFTWAGRLGGTGFDVPEGMTTDAVGNIYVVGRFLSVPGDFDPGPGTFNLSSSGNSSAFVSKLDSAGGFLGAAAFGGTFGTNANAVAVDGAGNVYTIGYFDGTADFDPGMGTSNLTASNTDVFVSKLDSTGDFVWAKKLGGSNFDVGRSIALDPAGNLYVAGTFRGTADFDPGAGTFNLTSGGSDDPFICKLDGGGNFVWAKQIAGTSFDQALAVAFADNAVFVAGRFDGTADFDPGPGAFSMTPGFTDTFVLKLDSGGSFVWAKGMGGPGFDPGVAIAVDPFGNIYAAGQFEDTADFDPGAGSYSLTSAGESDAFVVKLDAAGSLVWARRMGGADDDGAWAIGVAPSGNVYSAGAFRGTADFDPGLGTFNLTSAGEGDGFVCKLGPNGELAWAVRNGSASDDGGRALAVGTALLTTGWFQGTVDFDPTANVFNLTAQQYDTFITKYGSAEGAAAVPDGDEVSGVPLTVAKSGVGQVTLSWGSSCGPFNVDYEVYEGVLGSFTSHVPRTCTTGGNTSRTLTPGTGNRYFLVVPATESTEGSYGEMSPGIERPQSALSCLPQAVGSCL